jgi:hypothetical protein
MIYLKHYWMRDGQYLTEPGQNGSLQYHPGNGIDGFSVRYWLTDDRGVDYCLSTASDNALIQEHDPGMQILTRQEWDEIISTIPEPEPQPEPEGQPDWNTFKQTAVASLSLNTFVGELMSIAPVAASALPATLLLLESGTYTDFENTWNAIEALTTVPEALVAEFVALAEACNLPQEFIDIFAV